MFKKLLSAVGAISLLLVAGYFILSSNYNCEFEDYLDEHIMLEEKSLDEKDDLCYAIVRRPHSEESEIKAETYILYRYEPTSVSSRDEIAEVLRETYTLNENEVYSTELQQKWSNDFKLKLK